MLSAQLEGKGKEGFPTLHKHFEPLNWSPAPKIPVVIFCSWTAGPNEITLLWTDKRQKGENLFTSSTSKMKASHPKLFPYSPSSSASPYRKCICTLSWGGICSAGLKAQTAPGETFYLAGVNLIWYPSPQTAPLPTTSSRFLQIRVQSTDSEPSNLLSWEPQPHWCRGIRQSLQAVSRRLFPILLFKATSWAPEMLWRTSRDNRDVTGAGRERGTPQPSCLTALMYGGGRFTDSYSFYFWISVTTWKAVPALPYKQEHRKSG